MPSEQKRGSRPTLKTVAAEVGVSTATVSFVLAGRSDIGISEATAQRVHEAAKRLGYRPNRSARAVRTGRTGIVLLSLRMLADPWSLGLAETVSATAKRAGLTTMILADGDWFSALESQQVDVAYLGLGSDREGDLRKVATLVERGQKVVVFDERIEPAGFDVIRSDALPGARTAVNHLLSKTSDIGCVTSRENYESSPSRFSVFLETMAAAGFTVPADRIAIYEDTQTDAFTAALDLLGRPDRPQGVYATTDFAAIATLGAARRLGLRVPEDLLIVGLGNAPETGRTDPPLTTVGPDGLFHSIAELIVRRALEDPGVRGQGQLHEFSWVLIERESSLR